MFNAFDEKGNNSDRLSLISPDLSYIFRFMELAGILTLHSYSEIFYMTRINYFTIYKPLISSLKLICAYISLICILNWTALCCLEENNTHRHLTNPHKWITLYAWYQIIKLMQINTGNNIPRAIKTTHEDQLIADMKILGHRLMSHQVKTINGPPPW